MKLPGAEYAVVEVTKLHDSCLNPLHPRGRHKARVFASALRLAQPDAELLKTKLLAAIRVEDAAIGEADEYGERYVVDFECVNQDRRATVRSSWIIRRGDDAPRLVSCYVLSDKEAS